MHNPITNAVTEAVILMMNRFSRIMDYIVSLRRHFVNHSPTNNPEAETIAGAVEPEPEFDPETDLELQDDDLETAQEPETEPETEAEDPLVKVAKDIKEKAPQIVNLLKTIFG